MNILGVLQCVYVPIGNTEYYLLLICGDRISRIRISNISKIYWAYVTYVATKRYPEVLLGEIFSYHVRSGLYHVEKHVSL